MNKSNLRLKTIVLLFIVVLLTACFSRSGSGNPPPDDSDKDPSSDDKSSSEVIVEQLPADEITLPDITLSGVTLNPIDIIAVIEIEKEVETKDIYGIEGDMGPQVGYVVGTIDIGWFGGWEADEEPTKRMVVGLGTGAASYTDVVGGGGVCDESICCTHTYSWAVQYEYIGYFYAAPECRLYGSITNEKWSEMVLVESRGAAVACAVQLDDAYKLQFESVLLEFDYRPDSLTFLDITTSPTWDATVTTELKNFPWADGSCK